MIAGSGDAPAPPTSLRGAPPTPPACDLGRQRVERLRELLQRIRQPCEPRPGGLEPRLVDGVQPARAVGAHGHEPGVA